MTPPLRVAIVACGALAVFALSSCSSSVSQAPSGQNVAPVFAAPSRTPEPQVTLPVTLRDLQDRAIRFAQVAAGEGNAAVTAPVAEPAPSPSPMASTPAPSAVKDGSKARTKRTPAHLSEGRQRPSATPTRKPTTPAKKKAASRTSKPAATAAPQPAPAGESTPAASPAAAPAPVTTLTDVLAGPGLLVGLGGPLTQLDMATGETLPNTTMHWAACSTCGPLDVPHMLDAFSRDLADTSARTGVVRDVGPQASSLDPRGEVLGRLPTFVVHVDDASVMRWRTWYLVFDEAGEHVVALVGESGPLPAGYAASATATPMPTVSPSASN